VLDLALFASRREVGAYAQVGAYASFKKLASDGNFSDGLALPHEKMAMAVFCTNFRAYIKKIRA
jgi:hypothetical protein